MIRNEEKETNMISEIYPSRSYPVRLAIVFMFALLSAFYIFSSKSPIQITGDDEKLTVPMFSPAECFPISSEFSELSDQKCFPREDFTKLRPCMLEVNLSSSDSPHILVIGSTSSLGFAFANLMRDKGVLFAEIRGRHHFNVLNDRAFSTFESVRINLVINFAHGNSDSECQSIQSNINRHFSSRSIKVIDVLSDSMANKTFRAKNWRTFSVPPVFGPIPSRPGLSIPYCYPYESLMGMPLSKPSDEGKKYFYSEKVADTIYYSIDIYNDVKIENQLNFEPLSEFEIYRLFSSNSAFASIIISKSKATTISDGRPYTSYVTTVSDSAEIIGRFQNVLSVMASQLSKRITLPFEFIIAFCPSAENAGGFYKLLNVSDDVKRYMRVIEIRPDYLSTIKKKLNITYFPEYIIRNIGVRRASGEYIIAGSSDCIPPPMLYEFILYRQFFPYSYIRSRRVESQGKDIHRIESYMDEAKDTELTFVGKCTDSRFRDSFLPSSCGDFQGAHRMMWENVHGYIESNHVFHLDTVLSLDFAALPSSLVTKMLPDHVHISHVKTSTVTEHFPFLEESYTRTHMTGVLSREWNYRRDDWGASNESFREY